MTIGIVGLGYVGLPLALAFAEANNEVIGLDVDHSKIGKLASGLSYFKHIGSDQIAKVVKSGYFIPSSEFDQLSLCNAIIICVPTPLNKHREPDISYVLNTARTIAKYLRPGTLVVLESTTYPGTTEGELREILETDSGLKSGQDFYLA